MILPVHAIIRKHVAHVITHHYDLDQNSLPMISIDYPPNRTLGDLAITVAFDLARTLHKSPRLIAEELATVLGPIDGVARISATPNGYINFYLDRAMFVIKSLSELNTRGLEPKARTPLIKGQNPKPYSQRGVGETSYPLKTIVEHTAINPNKAAHIGHLRNATLGDTLVRLLRFLGITVETQNYIDNTGAQVADVVVGFLKLDRLDDKTINRLLEAPRFDYYCWDLYARVTRWYEGDQTRLAFRASVLRELEDGNNDTANLANSIAKRIVRRHLETMARINVKYDLLTWEGHILQLEFWAQAFKILKDAGAVFLQPNGPLAGCWVMTIDEDRTDPANSVSSSDSSREDKISDERTKVIVRSDGTVTYIGKDIAYQFWKFGLLGKDFYYQGFNDSDTNHLMWTTSAKRVSQTDIEGPPVFGYGSTVYNVIDTRQTYLQKLIQQALIAIHHKTEAKNSIHFSYEMVALSRATALALEPNSDVDLKQPFVEVSGRKGLGVKADDLLDRITETVKTEVSKRNPTISSEEHAQIAETIGSAAVRYLMIKYSRTKIIVFDIDEALSFEGESGPYLQYAVVRANNIFRKLREKYGLEENQLISTLSTTQVSGLESEDEGNDLWDLVLESARLDEIVEQSVRTLELSTLAKYTFELAQRFSAIYHRYPILNEDRKYIRIWRAVTVSYFRLQMTRALQLMGCDVPSRM